MLPLETLWHNCEFNLSKNRWGGTSLTQEIFFLFRRLFEQERWQQGMRKIIYTFLFFCVIVAPNISGTVHAASPIPPFTQCPAVGASPSCAILVIFNADGTTSILTDPRVGPFDRVEDTLVGVQNNSGITVPNMRISGNDIFGFDGDGICSGRYSPAPAGCPFGPTRYEGPNTSFSVVDRSHGIVIFTNGLASGTSAYFSLEGALTAASIKILRTIKLTYTGPTLIAQGQPATLSAVLKGDETLVPDQTVKVANTGTTLSAALKSEGALPISGKTVIISLGGQSCRGTTDGDGTAKCTIKSVLAASGNATVNADFAGDVFYPAAKDNKQVLVFAFLANGSFIVGDQTAASAVPNTTVTWWGAQWQELNSLSGGLAPAAFKGFANTLSMTPPFCGTTWTSGPGNSSGSPASVPSFMAVLAASTITKSGNRISGNTSSIVIVKTDPGYANNPGHEGTGTVVAVLCKSPNAAQISGGDGVAVRNGRIKKPQKNKVK